jgi:nicotinate-nucleotide--dimethylbenzimidazole phosphoribosyltransferase
MIVPPSEIVRAQAAARLASLATPPGALGRLGQLGVWLAACQGMVPPRQVEKACLVIFAGDHGVTTYGVSAFPRAITGAMVRNFLAGRAAVNALARIHDVKVRVLDLSVDDDFADLPEEVRVPLQSHKICKASGVIHLEDALATEQTRAALDSGARVAREEIAAGADLLISGDMGIGNTTPAAAIIGAALVLPAREVVGRGTGIDDAALAQKIAVVDAALARAGHRVEDPVDTLTTLGSADLAATTGFLLEAARAGIPVLLDGLMSVACALTADRMDAGAAAWYAAGHRSTEPAQSLAIAKLGFEPLLDLGLRLGEGSGAVTAVPLVRSAAALLRDVALLSEVVPGN